MTILAKFQNHLVRSINKFQKEKNFSSIIYCKLAIRRDLNNMEFNKPTAYNVEVSGDNFAVDIPGCSVPHGSRAVDAEQKESNVNDLHEVQKVSYFYEQNNALFKHTRYTVYNSANRQIYNRSLPDQASLQNVYLRSAENDPSTIHRYYSTGDVRKQREDHDSQVTSGFRRWIPTPLGNNTNQLNAIKGLEFKLMNYNVLAQDLLTEHPYLYKNHAPGALLWETRWKNLYREITEHNADIICLQEVQESHIPKFYSQFSNLGYGSIFKKRTGYRTDGCALYYRQNMFDLLDYILVEYFQPNTAILDRENVAIVAILAPKNEPKAKFVVATTHLLYNPRRQDIRVAQTQILLAEIERMAYKELNSLGYPEYYPVIITGDFNSDPDSAVVELITRSNLQYDMLQRKSLLRNNHNNTNLVNLSDINGKFLIPPRLGITDRCQHFDLVVQRTSRVDLSRQEQEKFVHIQNSNRTTDFNLRRTQNATLFSTGKLAHNFNLKSVFKHKVGNDTVGTTYQDAWITVDYIFYSLDNEKEGKLKLTSRYTIPTTRQLNTVKTIPNFVLGSDHLSLLSKFKLEF